MNVFHNWLLKNKGVIFKLIVIAGTDLLFPGLDKHTH